MTNLVRTSITLEDDLLQQAKLYALTHKTSVSYLIRNGILSQLKGVQVRSQLVNRGEPKKSAIPPAYMANPLKYKKFQGKVKQGKKVTLLDIAGTLNLKGKEPPTRSELYARHLKQKMGF